VRVSALSHRRQSGGIVFQHSDEIGHLPLHVNATLLDDQRIPRVKLFGTQRRVDQPQILKNFARADGEDRADSATQVIGKPEPCCRRYHAASGEAQAVCRLSPCITAVFSRLLSKK